MRGRNSASTSLRLLDIDEVSTLCRCHRSSKWQVWKGPLGHALASVHTLHTRAGWHCNGQSNASKRRKI